ncbi:MAG: DUF427 domain-containing protein [Actinobacteria bacterium]|nr:DUF427 domain-containing protein [Actinomycetota bacterium]MBW3642718.1 DUF427 domain-containing protein [Actinomycetota bacterium]
MLAHVRPHRIPPGPGQESVWDYPRPPVLEPVAERIRVVLAGVTIADTRRALRVLETTHPPNYYVPPGDVDSSSLRPSERRSLCEFKGVARYWTVAVGELVEVDAAWSYPDPVPAFAALADHVAFYPGRVGECWVGEERATPQPGGFYGGWVTSTVVGPFKGGPGSMGW